MSTFTPGIYFEKTIPTPPSEFRTGVPVFLGLAAHGEVNEPQLLTLWPQFKENLGTLSTETFLSLAVRGFFENGGNQCYVMRLDDVLGSSGISTDLAEDALNNGLTALTALDTIDLICAPDIMWWYLQEPSMARRAAVLRMQQSLLKHCETLGDRFAILNALPLATEDYQVADHPQDLKSAGQSGANGALYYPWIQVSNGFVPPCGHIAGVYARSDRRVGVHKAPANEILQGVLDLEVNLTNEQQAVLNPVGINCLRAFPGRGIRVWGARTLSVEPAWCYVNVRRLFLTAQRWIEHNIAGVVFEPNDDRLWRRIVRELTVYFDDLFQRGALKGRTAQEAFYVKCDAATNPPQVREAGIIITEIGLAPAVPNEFVVIRIVHNASGVTMSI